MASLTADNNSTTVDQLKVQNSAAAIKALEDYDSISTLTVQPQRSKKTKHLEEVEAKCR